MGPRTHTCGGDSFRIATNDIPSTQTEKQMKTRSSRFVLSTLQIILSLTSTYIYHQHSYLVTGQFNATKQVLLKVTSPIPGRSSISTCVLPLEASAVTTFGVLSSLWPGCQQA